MGNKGVVISFSIATIILFTMLFINKRHAQKITNQENSILQVTIKLPVPDYKSGTSVEEALLKRRSIRDYKKSPLQLKEIAQLLWAAQGITSQEDGGRTAPSAGALYPLEIYVASGIINSVAPGVYHYMPSDHTLELITDGDKRKLLMAAALMQGAVGKSAGVVIIAAEYSRTTTKYMERGRRYVLMEAGHVAQNIYLQAVSLNIGTVVMGAFSDSLVKKIIQLPKNEEPLYLMPVGKI